MAGGRMISPLTCPHNTRVGDNYGESCMDCGKQLSGYGYGGWFGSRISGTQVKNPKCIHVFAPVEGGEACIYCEEWREIKA